ncbi:MAG: ATP-binding cassette domain-containing protein [Sedimentibacter sp.]|uniref:ABC transporter ATP-binding protein n=1 Tax=Sedimentibacter sp. TaxID=1960295 RepID=UPI002981A5CB|nr:oligopeptide/dipeptide ABC transporter ATP-binding protein [Sedimentibacter sp.]MDW5299570.1 ATP-binding cassette domain-containing protein [Sedimentibacter sp.]
MSKISNDSPLIELKHLKKYYSIGKSKKLHAVDDINAKISKGTTLGVVGESGCGKTTLGRTLLKLIEPTSGEILFEGEDIAKLNNNQMRKYRKSMQIIFQDPYSSLNPRKSVYETIATPLIVNKVFDNKNDMEKRVKEVMDICGLPTRLTNSFPHELDGGRRQRICIARALALKPKFIVCDEPVSALDVSIQAQILNLLMDLQDEMGLAYMFITHDLSVVKHISDEIMVMYLGMCIEKAPSKEIFKNPIHPYTRALLSAIPVPNISSRTRKIEVVRGELTSPIDPVPGCRFAPRCEYSQPQCTGKNMELNEISPNHFVACPVMEKMLGK